MPNTPFNSLADIIKHLRIDFESLDFAPGCLPRYYTKHRFTYQVTLTPVKQPKKQYPKDKCVHELFKAQVENSPDAIAVVFEERALNYRDLNERANQLARYLKKLGIGPESLVGICVERSLEMIIGILGILKMGGAYVPLDPSYPKDG